jgi:hypothetical protein
MPIDDEDMIYIQSLFIFPPEWHRQRNVERLVLIGCTGFVMLLGIVLLMTSK